MYSYDAKGVCCKKINFDIIDGKVKDVKFTNGCDGNLKGLAALVEGLYVQDAIKKLKGITCGPRHTSCPDQLALALERTQ